MIIGIPKEVKIGEFRVATTPDCVRELVKAGHTVLIENGAGIEASILDQEFSQSGAIMVTREKVWDAEMIVKVKEPTFEEYGLLKEKQIIFSYLHLAGSDKDLTLTLLKKKVTGLAMETVEDKEGRLILAYPMSAIAGRMAIQVGCQYLSKLSGGEGSLIDSVPGVEPAKVVVIGAGTAGSFAAKAAFNRGARVVIFDIREDRLSKIKSETEGKIKTLISTPEGIAKEIIDADLVVGAALVPGARTPHLVSEEMVKSMKKKAILVDIAVDQGGCFATSEPRTHDNPVFVKHGKIHYCVPNMPGIYSKTATLALTKFTFPYVKEIAKEGLKALMKDSGLLLGLNTFNGKITCKAVAKFFDLEENYLDLSEDQNYLN
jgi:alanine dehydrogenase